MTGLLGRITAMRQRHSSAETMAAAESTAETESETESEAEKPKDAQTPAATTPETDDQGGGDAEANQPLVTGQMNGADPAAVRAEAAQVIELCAGNTALGAALVKHGIGLEAAKDIVAAAAKGGGLPDAQARAFDRLVAGQSPEITNKQVPGQSSERAEADALWARVRAKSETGRKEA